MRVQILKNCFKPEVARSKTILKKDSIVELPDDQAQHLIQKGYAVELKVVKAAEKPADDEPKAPDEPKKGKKKSDAA